MIKISDQIKSYLKKRAEDKWLNWQSCKKYKTVIVVPSIKEYQNIPTLVDSLSLNDIETLQNSLILFVVNNSEESSDDVKVDNLKTLKLLENLKAENDLLNVDFIDASTNGSELPSKDAGVGLARKIGMDQALLCLDYSQKGNAIVCLDADCTVGQNYLTQIQKYFENDYNAAVVKYQHELDNDAIINYEIFLRYYVFGLIYSNSPYAYHSIGSCMVVDPFTYVKIGGMNKKKAGEDFYFLEKAAKLVEVKSIDSTTVYPSSRKSWRVPFGTGQRITRFYEKVKNEYVLYNPESFKVLKEFLTIYFDEGNNSTENILEGSKSISESLYNFLIENSFSKSMNRIYENVRSESQLRYQKKLWFDSFKTLKLIHYLRDNGYPEQPMFLALNKMFDLMKVNNFEKYRADTIPPIEKQKEYLNILRNLT